MFLMVIYHWPVSVGRESEGLAASGPDSGVKRPRECPGAGQEVLLQSDREDEGPGGGHSSPRVRNKEWKQIKEAQHGEKSHVFRNILTLKGMFKVGDFYTSSRPSFVLNKHTEGNMQKTMKNILYLV